MIVFGALAWLLLACAYAVVGGGVLVGWLLALRKLGPWAWPTCLLAAMLAAVVCGPIGCLALYVPHRFVNAYGEAFWVKPRIVDNLALAYLLPFASAFVAVLLGLAFARRKPRVAEDDARA